MSRGPENTFIASVHRLLPPGLYRMKNHNEYIGGVADVWYSGNYADLWVEYKFIQVPKRASTEIDTPGLFSALQLDWLRNRGREGRNVAAIVGSKDGGVIYVNEAWEHRITAAEYCTELLPRKDLADWIVRQVQKPDSGRTHT